MSSIPSNFGRVPNLLASRLSLANLSPVTPCVAKVYAAPFAAYQLGLHGADVICIEEPGKGNRYFPRRIVCFLVIPLGSRKNSSSFHSLM